MSFSFYCHSRHCYIRIDAYFCWKHFIKKKLNVFESFLCLPTTQYIYLYNINIYLKKHSSCVFSVTVFFLCAFIILNYWKAHERKEKNDFISTNPFAFSFVLFFNICIKWNKKANFRLSFFFQSGMSALCLLQKSLLNTSLNIDHTQTTDIDVFTPSCCWMNACIWFSNSVKNKMFTKGCIHNIGKWPLCCVWVYNIPAGIQHVWHKNLYFLGIT